MKILMTLVADEDADEHPCAEVLIDTALIDILTADDEQPIKNIRRASYLAGETQPFIHAMLDKLNERGQWL